MIDFKHPFTDNWLSKNITSVIALSIVWFALYLFRLVLLKEVKADDEVTKTIITSITAILMFVLGFYFGAQHVINKNKEELETPNNSDGNNQSQ